MTKFPYSPQFLILAPYEFEPSEGFSHQCII